MRKENNIQREVEVINDEMYRYYAHIICKILKERPDANIGFCLELDKI
jgi:hypothetical protein